MSSGKFILYLLALQYIAASEWVDKYKSTSLHPNIQCNVQEFWSSPKGAFFYSDDDITFWTYALLSIFL